MVYERLADSIIKHPKAIVLAWVLVLLVGSVFAIRVGEVMTYDTTDMAPDDSESIIGMNVMSDNFPSSDASESAAPLLVLPYDDEKGIKAAQDFADALDAAAEHHEYTKSVMKMDPSDPYGKGIIIAMLTVEGLDSSEVIEYTPQFRLFVSEVKEATGYTGATFLTGSTAISYDMEVNSMEDISKIDPFTVLLILVFIGLFFRSFVTSAAPPMVIGVAFVVTTGLIFILGQFMKIFFITDMMILVSMMGAGCDYCIFIISRYREELRAGKTHEDALRASIMWAGESITISGAAVVIGFGAMAVCNYSMISTMGICLAMGIIIALLAALTLIPAILALVGDKIFWPTTMKAFEEGGKATKGWYAWCGRVSQAYFHRSAKFSLKHAKAILMAAIVVTAPAAYLAMTTETSYDMITAMLSGESGDGMQYVSEYADQGLVMPGYTVIEYKNPIAEVIAPEDPDDEKSFGQLIWTEEWTKRIAPGLEPMYDKMLEDDNIVAVNGPFQWERMLELIDEAGLTDATPDEKIEFIKSVSSTKVGMFIDALVDGLKEEDVDMKMLFKSISQIMDDEAFKAIERQLDCDLPAWSDMVQSARNIGYTESSEIIDWVVDAYAVKLRSAITSMAIDRIAAQIAGMGLTPGTPEYQAAFQYAKDMAMPSIRSAASSAASGFKDGINEMREDMDDSLLVYGFSATIDYVVNIMGGFVGGPFVVDGEVNDGYVTYIAVTSATEKAAMSPRSMESISSIVDASKAYQAENGDLVENLWNTGVAVVMFDVSQAVKKEFTMIEVLVIVLIIILLFVAMRSYVIPIRSMLTIGMSIIWTLAMTSLVFVHILNIEMLWMIPLLLLVICLGLGMDYDILLTTRIKENRLSRGMSNDDAIYHAVTHTGSVITICGLIMGGAFGTLMLSGMPMFKEFGFALCFAILCDALIVRTYIVPAVMHLLGDWNWKGPGSKEKLQALEEKD